MRVTKRRLRRGQDEGFTLIEMVITVALLGIISVILFGVIIQYLKVTGATRTRLSESTDQQFISTYWQNDVSSLGRRGFTPANAADPVPTNPSVYVGTAGPSNCGATVGVMVVAFAWGEYPINAAPAAAWTPTAQEVAYVRVGSAAPYALKRVRCKAGVEGSPLTVAHNLTGTPTIICDIDPCTGATLPNRVSMRFTVRDTSEPTNTGYTTTVSADRRQG